MARLRVASEAEVERLQAFYVRAMQEQPFLLPRPDQDFVRAIERRTFFVVESGSELVAASGVFNYADEAPFVELGDTYVAPLIRGFSLQRLLFRLRISAVVLTQGGGPESIGISTAVNPRNAPSLANANKMGFVPWAAPHASVFDGCPSCANYSALQGRRCCCDYYELPVTQIRDAVRQLLDDTEGERSFRARSSDSRELVVELNCLVVQDPEARAALREFLGAPHSP